MKKNELEKSILSTICYFDVFDYPLTLLEIWQWLFDMNDKIDKVDINEVSDLLDNSDYLLSRIQSKDGLFFLSGRSDIIKTRLSRYAISGEKNSIARRGLSALRCLPFIKLVGICNNSGNNNTRPDSDIDLFIMTSNNRLYTARFLTTLVLSVMGLRRHGKKITDRLCLSFYATEKSSDLEQIKINENDIYLIYWVANLFPVYDNDGYKHFYDTNTWINRYLPNRLPKYSTYRRRVEHSGMSKITYRLLEKLLSGYFGNLIENILKKTQVIKMSKNRQSLATCNDSRVIINDNMLKFHENDRRLMYYQKFVEKLSQVI